MYRSFTACSPKGRSYTALMRGSLRAAIEGSSSLSSSLLLLLSTSQSVLVAPPGDRRRCLALSPDSMAQCVRPRSCGVPLIVLSRSNASSRAMTMGVEHRVLTMSAAEGAAEGGTHTEAVNGLGQGGG